ncbi:HAD family hydrolase, partial [Candidatus Bathyarchaeota archaeon]
MPRLVINGNHYSLKLIIFDVDGTLVDDLHRYSSLGKARYNAFIEKASMNAAEEWAKLAGVNPQDWTIDPMGPISKAPRRDDVALAAGALYLDGHGWYDAKELAETIYEKADEAQKRSYHPRLFDGVEEKLRELKEAGFTLGIATNGVTKITEELLEELGIRELFSVVIGADLVEKSKPAPDMILKACRDSGYVAPDCMYVGDQPTDMEAANNALVQ